MLLTLLMVYAHQLRMRWLASLALAILLAACAGNEPPPPAMLRVARAGPVTASAPEATPRAAADAAERALQATRGRPVDPAAAPFLHDSPVGRAFLAAPPEARAIARGDPPERCPVSGLARAPDVANLATAAEEALRLCLGARDAAAIEAGCGCRLLAVGDALLASQTELLYAPGVGARLIGLGDGHALIARERAGPDGDLLVLFETVAGPVAGARLAENGDAELTLAADGARFHGRRDRIGWRRGRLVERLLLKDAEGRKLIALIGIEPLDYVALGPALAAWPRDG